MYSPSFRWLRCVTLDWHYWSFSLFLVLVYFSIFSYLLFSLFLLFLIILVWSLVWSLVVGRVNGRLTMGINGSHSPTLPSQPFEWKWHRHHHARRLAVIINTATSIISAAIFTSVILQQQRQKEETRGSWLHTTWASLSFVSLWVRHISQRHPTLIYLIHSSIYLLILV